MATLMVAIPFAAYKWIENPCIDIGRRAADHDLPFPFLKVKQASPAQEIA